MSLPNPIPRQSHHERFVLIDFHIQALFNRAMEMGRREGIIAAVDVAYANRDESASIVGAKIALLRPGAIGHEAVTSDLVELFRIAREFSAKPPNEPAVHRALTLREELVDRASDLRHTHDLTDDGAYEAHCYARVMETAGELVEIVATAAARIEESARWSRTYASDEALARDHIAKTTCPPPGWEHVLEHDPALAEDLRLRAMAYLRASAIRTELQDLRKEVETLRARLIEANAKLAGSAQTDDTHSPVDKPYALEE